MKSKLAVLGLLAGLMAAPLAHANTTINTVQAFSGDYQPFGEANTATYGQSFTVGADHHLNSFSMFLDNPPALVPGYPPVNLIDGSVDFKAYVYAWNGAEATGSALYTSSLQSYFGTGPGAPQEFAFNVGSIDLTSGQQYVAFVSTSGLQNGKVSTTGMPYSGVFGTDQLAGGQFVYYNNGDDFSLLTSHGWDVSESNYTNLYGDSWFKAGFSGDGVPEPASWALMIIGFGAAGSLLRRRRSSPLAA